MKSFASSEIPFHWGIGNVNSAFFTCAQPASQLPTDVKWFNAAHEFESSIIFTFFTEFAAMSSGKGGKPHSTM
jgi:hypothetical protein